MDLQQSTITINNDEQRAQYLNKISNGLLTLAQNLDTLEAQVPKVNSEAEEVQAPTELQSQIYAVKAKFAFAKDMQDLFSFKDTIITLTKSDVVHLMEII